jgi:hypothetical protein
MTPAAFHATMIVSRQNRRPDRIRNLPIMNLTLPVLLKHVDAD